MPVKRKTGRTRITGLSEIAEALLRDQPVDPQTHAERVEEFCLTDCDGADPSPGVPGLRRLWEAHGAAILAEWVEIAPGTRPSCWWRWSSPRWQRQSDLGEPRQLTGAEIEPWHLRQTDFALGVPAVAVLRVGRGSVQVESQAAYLRRHRLLLPGEAKWLTSKDFALEAVDVSG